MEGEENEGIFYDKVDPKNSDESQNSSSLGINRIIWEKGKQTFA